MKKDIGTVIDYKHAALWYEKSVKQGYKKAQRALGFLYAEGRGVTKNID